MIAGFLEESFIDFPDVVPSSVIFFSGCNYRCPACHAKDVVYGKNNIEEEEIFSYHASRKGFNDGTVICGGEPTMYAGLPRFITRLKEIGLKVKLDTNGSNPEMIARLLQDLDYVALDVKSSPENYDRVSGIKTDLRKIMTSMKIISEKARNYEFRTTIVPVVRNNEISFMTGKEVVDARRFIYTATGIIPEAIIRGQEKQEEAERKAKLKWYLQKFVPRKNHLLDERLESFPETPQKLMEEIQKAMNNYFV